MYKAVLFDLDGTLTDTLRDIADAMNRALRLHDLPEFAVEDYKYLVGNGAKKLIFDVRNNPGGCRWRCLGTIRRIMKPITW